MPFISRKWAHLSRGASFTAALFFLLGVCHVHECLHDRVPHHVTDKVMIDAAVETELLAKLINRGQHFHHALLAFHELREVSPRSGGAFDDAIIHP